MAFTWEDIERDDGGLIRQCDLSGHYWAELSRDPSAQTWLVRILDYENNLMACAAGLTESHAIAVVEQWDRDVVQAATDPTPIANAGGVLTIDAGA